MQYGRLAAATVRPIIDRLAALPRWVGGVAAVGCAMAVRGVWMTPNIADWLAMAREPLGTPAVPPTNTYIMSSPLPAVTAGLLGFAHNEWTFATFHLIVLLGSLVLTMRAVSRRAPGAEWLLLAVFISSPISTVTFTWLGQPDAYVVGLGAALVFLRRPPAVLAVAALLALTSFEQGVYVVASVGLVAAPLLGARRWIHAPAAAAGLLIGRVLLTGYQTAFGIDQETSRWEWLSDHGIWQAIQSQLGWWPVTVVSMFSVTWIFVVWWFRTAVDIPLAGGVAVAFAAALVPMTLSYDHSRVFAIITWPMLVAMVVWAGEHVDPSGVRRVVRLVLPVGIIVPAVLVGTPQLYGVAWPEILWNRS